MGKMDRLNCTGDMMLRICDVYSTGGGSKAETLQICKDLMQLITGMNLSDEQTENFNRIAALVVLSIHKAHNLGELGIKLELEAPVAQRRKKSRKRILKNDGRITV